MPDSLKSRGQQMFFGLFVVMTWQYVHLYCTVHSAVKTSLAVPHVLNVILRLNTKIIYMILRRMKLSKRQFLVTKNRVALKVRSTNQSTKSSCKVTECIA